MLWLQPGQRPLFPEARFMEPDEIGMVALGGDIQPDALIEAYSKGVFPWDGNFPHPWFSPRQRCLLRPQDFHCSKTLARLDASDRYMVIFDKHFREIMRECMKIPRRGQTGTWITPAMIDSYTALFDAGLGFCAGVFNRHGQLVGGLYGLRLGKAYFGESMFSIEPNTSKLALYHLCLDLQKRGVPWIDCQQDTPHLRSLGSHLVSREKYLDLLEEALTD
jgi:leucyl/phenylalanyl-tRNA--protein transferase